MNINVKLQHTPGPWKWGIMDYSAAVLHGKDLIYDSIMSISPCDSCLKQIKNDPNPTWIWGRCMTPSEANARIIVVAPEMLDALIDKSMCRRCNQYPNYCDNCQENRHRVLIEKATNKTIIEVFDAVG